MIKSSISAIARAIKDNPLEAWLIMYSIWLIDLFSTVIALAVVEEGAFIEANPIAAWFFSFGVFGWFIWMIAVAMILYILLRLPDVFMFTIKWFKKDKEYKHRKIMSDYFRIFVFSALIISESYIIVHNVVGLLNYFGLS